MPTGCWDEDEEGEGVLRRLGFVFGRSLSPSRSMATGRLPRMVSTVPPLTGEGETGGTATAAAGGFPWEGGRRCVC